MHGLSEADRDRLGEASETIRGRVEAAQALAQTPIAIPLEPVIPWANKKTEPAMDWVKCVLGQYDDSNPVSRGWLETLVCA